MVLTFRAVKFAAPAAAVAATLVVALGGLAACSREQQDWRSAEAADSVEAYSEFLKDHPDSELVRQARARLTQVSEDRAWTQAGTADTVDAYKQFLAQYPNGKWAQEAHIRVENFELGAAPSAVAANSLGVAGAAPGLNGPSSAGGAAMSPAAGSGPAGEPIDGPTHPTSAPSSVAAAQLSAQASPGGSAQLSTALSAGEAAQLPTSPSGATTPATAALQSPRPPTYPVGVSTTAAPAAAGSAGAVASAAPNISATAAIPASSTASVAAAAPSSLASAWRSADPTSYGVQLGAFASENAATSQWQQLVERFNAQLRGLAPHVVSAETATGRLFRLQALVADEATARALCDMLRRESQACVPVLPH